MLRGDHVRGLAEAYLAAGRLEDADGKAREAREWSARLGERADEAAAEYVLNEIARRRGEAASARGRFALPV